MLRVALWCELLYGASCSMVRVALCGELLYVASCLILRVALCGELPLVPLVPLVKSFCVLHRFAFCIAAKGGYRLSGVKCRP